MQASLSLHSSLTVVAASRPVLSLLAVATAVRATCLYVGIGMSSLSQSATRSLWSIAVS